MNILHTIIHGLITSMGMRAMSMGLRFLTICILPFWMSPTEIGLTALILVLVNLPATFVDLGLGTALIKEKECSTDMFSSVFCTVAISALLFAGAIIFLAPRLESSFELPAFLTVTAAFALPFHAMAIVPNAILQKNLKFTSLAVRDGLGEIAFSGAAITLAVLDYGPIAIAVAAVFQRFVRWIIASISVEWAPKLQISGTALKKLASFSFFQCISLSLNQLFYQIDKILLAAWLSPASLGLYSQAQQLTFSPIHSLASAAMNVFFASFAKVQDNTETLQKLFSKILKGIILASGALLAILPPAIHLIPIIYNDTWTAAVPIALATTLFIPTFCGFILEGIMIAIGGEKRRIVSTTAQIAILVAGIVGTFTLFPEFTGPIAVAIIFGIATTTAVLINLFFIIKRLQIQNFRQFASSIAIAAILAAAGLSIGFML